MFEKKGDKYVVEFNKKPALLFVSFDGDGSKDCLLENGVEDPFRKSVSIYSEVGEETTYTVTKCPFDPNNQT